MTLRANISHIPSRLSALQALVALSLIALALRLFGAGGPMELDLTSSPDHAGDCVYVVSLEDTWIGAAFFSEPQPAAGVVSRLLGKTEGGPENETSVAPCGCKIIASAGGSHIRIEPLKGNLLIAAGRPVDLNRAEETDLVAAPGIGPVLASRIIAFREAHGPFNRIEDLMSVPGIGKKKLAQFQPFITTGVLTRSPRDEVYPKTIRSPSPSNTALRTSRAMRP